MESMFTAFKELNQWVADEILNARWVLLASVVALLTTSAFAGSAWPTSLWNSSFIFFVTTVDVSASNIECNGQGKDIDERKNIWLIVNDGDSTQSFANLS